MDDTTILNQLPIDRSICFSTEKGEQSGKVQKQQGKLLAKLGPFLKKILEPDEKILYALPAMRPMTAVDHLFRGWHAYYIKACALVFTNKRMLYLSTGANGKPRLSPAQARYGDITSFATKGWLSWYLELVYKSGRKEQFTIQAAGTKKKANSFLPKLVPGGEGTDRRERHFLCPRCVKPLAKDVYLCPSCRLQFKTMSQAVRYALLVPGGGYFFTGHTGYGILTVAVELLFVIILLSTMVAAHGNGELMAAPVLLLVLFAAYQIVGMEHARDFVEQYIPVEKD
jgi:hypothetical protein